MDSSNLDHLFRRVALGDREAVKDAFSALHPIVRRYCLTRLQNSSEADDATQTSLMKMFEQASDYDGRSSALGWALSIAYFECQTLRKRNYRAALRLGSAEVTDRPTALPDPETALSEEQLARIAADLVSELSPSDRSLLGEGLVGSLRKVAPASLRKRKQRVLSRLKSAFLAIVGPEGGAGGRRS